VDKVISLQVPEMEFLDQLNNYKPFKNIMTEDY
jgi:hypothetical protein